jgi:uncharacterized cupin superfamily protein
MKKIIVIAAVAALGACSKPAPAPEATATTEPAAAPAAVTMAADGKPSTGTFKITSADGEVIMEEIKADGTYVDTKDGKVVETGKWEQKSPAQYCWTKDEAGATQVCADEKVENGVYSSYNPVTKKTSTVERIEG